MSPRIWQATAEMRLESLVLDSTLTFQAPDFAAAVAHATAVFQVNGIGEATGVTRARCRWEDGDGQPCTELATRLDGYCDGCRQYLPEVDGLSDAELGKLSMTERMALHKAQDGHCTCNNCMEEL